MELREKLKQRASSKKSAKKVESLKEKRLI